MRFVVLLVAQVAGLGLAALGVYLLWGYGVTYLASGVLLVAVATLAEINGPPAPPPSLRRKAGA